MAGDICMMCAQPKEPNEQDFCPECLMMRESVTVTKEGWWTLTNQPPVERDNG